MAPELLFSFVRTRPGLWALVMILYPVLSVYPQGIIYRSFLMHRYASLLPPGLASIVISAAAFAFMHIIFRNPLAVVLTFFGGLLFAWRYATTGSLFTSALEHALYGCWLFTIGLGQYLYHGRIALDDLVDDLETEDRAVWFSDHPTLIPCSPTTVNTDRRLVVPRSWRTCWPRLTSSKVQPAERAET